MNKDIQNIDVPELNFDFEPVKDEIKSVSTTEPKTTGQYKASGLLKRDAIYKDC